MNTQILSPALERLLGVGAKGDVAFTRAFPGDDIRAILNNGIRSFGEWRVIGVGAAEADGWLEAPVAVIEMQWRLSPDERKDAAYDLRAAGLIECRTISYHEGGNTFRSRTQMRPNVAKILHFLSLACDEKTYQIAITEAGNVREITGDSISRNIPPYSSTVQSEAVPVDAGSGVIEAQKNTETPGEVGVTPKAEEPTTNIPEILEADEERWQVLQTLKETFPEGWTPEHLERVKRLVDFPNNDLRMSPANIQLWTRLRRGEESFMEMDLNPWQIECDLDCLLKNWYPIWRFIQKYRYIKYRYDTEIGSKCLANLPQYLGSFAPDVYRKYLDYNQIARTCKRPTLSLREFLTTPDWFLLPVGGESEVLQRFMGMHQLGESWPELIEQHQADLNVFLCSAPHVYLALKDFGFPVVVWLGEAQHFDFRGRFKTELRELRRKESVAQRWCGELGKSDNLVTWWS